MAEQKLKPGLGHVRSGTRKPAAVRTPRLGFSGRGVQEDALFEESLIDEEADLLDFSDDEDDEHVELAPIGAAGGRILPIWLCAGDAILWCNPRFGFHIQFRERLRRLLETTIGPEGLQSLGKTFETADTEERLSLLFGFFREVWLREMFGVEEPDEDVSSDKKPPASNASLDKSSSGKTNLQSKLYSLNSVGMLLEKGDTVPLSIFFARQGEKTKSIPRRLERYWVCHIFRERGLDANFKWKDVKEWLPSEYERFIAGVRSLLTRIFPGIAETKLPGVNLETLQRKKLTVFKEYLEEMEADEKERGFPRVLEGRRERRKEGCGGGSEGADKKPRIMG
jgi:hypothetical protein